MAIYGYVRGSNAAQEEMQRDRLASSGIAFDGVFAEAWEDFLPRVSEGDKVVAVSVNRLSRDPDECRARVEMLALVGAEFASLSDDGVVGRWASSV